MREKGTFAFPKLFSRVSLKIPGSVCGTLLFICAGVRPEMKHVARTSRSRQLHALGSSAFKGMKLLT